MSSPYGSESQLPQAPQVPPGWQQQPHEQAQWQQQAQWQAPPTAPPSPVVNAFRLMVLRAAIGAISLVVTLATKDALKRAILDRTPSASQSTIDAAFNVVLVLGVVFLVLYLLLAFQVRRGCNWARIVTWVLAGLGIAGTLLGLAQAATTANRVFSLITGLIDLAIVVLLAQGPSNRYFARR